METYTIRILATEPFRDNPISVVYAELPNGIRAWFFPLMDAKITSLTPTVYFDITPLYGEDDIKVISKADTVEYFKSNNDCEHGISFICGKVLSMRDWKEKWYDVELECLGVVFNLNIFKESVPNIEVGCHLQLEVSASIGTEQ